MTGGTQKLFPNTWKSNVTYFISQVSKSGLHLHSAVASDSTYPPSYFPLFASLILLLYHFPSRFHPFTPCTTFCVALCVSLSVLLLYVPAFSCPALPFFILKRAFNLPSPFAHSFRRYLPPPLCLPIFLPHSSCWGTFPLHFFLPIGFP